jgi:hypothetical protein
MSDTFDPFAQEVPAKAAPAVANDRPAAPGAGTYDPFAAKPATEAAAALPSLPQISAGSFVVEKGAGPNGEDRLGIVVKAGELPAEPGRSGPRHAVVVAWLSQVSHPIVTDQLEVVG